MSDADSTSIPQTITDVDFAKVLRWIPLGHEDVIVLARIQARLQDASGERAYLIDVERQRDAAEARLSEAEKERDSALGIVGAPMIRVSEERWEELRGRLALLENVAEAARAAWRDDTQFYKLVAALRALDGEGGAG